MVLEVKTAMLTCGSVDENTDRGWQGHSVGGVFLHVFLKSLYHVTLSLCCLPFCLPNLAPSAWRAASDPFHACEPLTDREENGGETRKGPDIWKPESEEERLTVKVSELEPFGANVR